MGLPLSTFPEVNSIDKICEIRDTGGHQSINQSINTLLTGCSLTSGVMAMQALPPAEARVIRTPALAHETVNTKENGVLPSKTAPNQSQNSIHTPAMPSIPRCISHLALTLACCFLCISIPAIPLWYPKPSPASSSFDGVRCRLVC
jgi:hypothetical protein